MMENASSLMMGGSVGLLTWWMLSLSLPDEKTIDARRQSLSTRTKKLLAYGQWAGSAVLRVMALLWPSSATRLERAADRLALQADRPGEITGVEVIGFSVLAPLAAGPLSYVYASALVPRFALPVAALCTLMAAALPASRLRERRDARQKSIRRSLPNALDLLTLCVEAGMDFTEGLKQVAGRAARGREDFALCKLFGELLSDIQIGAQRGAALKRLQEKTGLPELGAFAGVLTLADSTGGSVGASLRQLAVEMRNTRVMRAEETIAKASTKLIFPIMIFMFPVALAITVLPLLFFILERIRF